MNISDTSGKFRVLLSASVLAVLTTGCATISTGAHYDETTNFAQYKSFSWIDEQPHIVGSEETGIIISPLTQARVQQSIRSTLENKGYTFIDDRDTADIVVAYTIGTRQEISTSSYPDRYYGSWGWHIRGSHYYINETTAHRYTKGTLGIDIFDNDSMQPVWHGWAEKTITSDDKQDPKPAIDKGVRKIFDAFPPPR